MRRRDFIILGGGAVAWPLSARAQQAERMRRVGILMGLAESDPEGRARANAFLRTLHQSGWIEEKNVHLDWRWPAGDVARTQTDAIELVNSSPDVIMVNTPPGLSALRQATLTIPIVFAQVTDVSESGVANPAHPQGNITGFATFLQLRGERQKRPELLKEIAPAVTRIGFLQNPAHPSWPGYVSSMEAAAARVRLQVYPAPAKDEADIGRVLLSIPAGGNGVVVLPDTFTVAHRDQIIALAKERRVPAMYPSPFFATGGGLVSYGADLVGLVGLTATYVDRILRGVRPEELPVQSSSKFSLVINLQTAKSLGLDIPPMLLARADEVIE